jgi:hypothetical protein
LDLRNGLTPVIVSATIWLPFGQPDHVRAMTNCFVFVIKRFGHLHLPPEFMSKRQNHLLTRWTRTTRDASTKWRVLLRDGTQLSHQTITPL